MTPAGDPDPAATANRAVFGTGTSAEEWRSAEQWQQTPTVELDELVPPGDRLLVVAPHPDDEVLGSGGLLHAAVQHGRRVLVLVVTDGEASHPGSARWKPDRLGPTRIAESRAALGELGIGDGQLVRLGLGDGQLVRQQAEVSRAVVRHLNAHDVVVTPWRYDGHTDHEIVADAVIDALQVLPVQHIEVPIWGLHWARPDQGVLPWHRAVRLVLDEHAQKRKAAAAECFGSQLAPDETTGRDAVIPQWALDRLVGDDELYFR